MRKCVLDLAPEAPWNCPEECSSFEPRLADVNWRHGSLVTPPTPEAPPSVGEDSSIAALLDEAEDIINAAVPDVRAEVEEEQAKQARKQGKRFGGRRPWWPFGR
jgi:hypothetical protein